MKNEELNMEYNKLLDEYEIKKKKKLNIDMSRGKPSKEQLELSNDILNMKITDVEIDGFDIRNYGCLNGLPSARRLFADVFKVDESEIIKYMVFNYNELLELEEIGYIMGGNTKLALAKTKKYFKK